MSRLVVGRIFTLGAFAYALLAALAGLISAYRGSLLVTTEPWLPFSAGMRIMASIGGGVALAAITVFSTPILVRASARARALRDDLRPNLRHATDASLVVMAFASGVSEELFFRGALVQWLGVVASSALFGLVHQTRGSARWLWVSWASAMGVLLALLFQATGYLAGCIVAHVAVNAANLRFVRDYESTPRAQERRLGGLLQRERASRRN
jgi:uncharacterized protein